MSDEQIEQAAVRGKSGRLFTLPRPYRHCDIYLEMPRSEIYGRVEGFITTTGRFVDRQEAWLIVCRAGQPFRTLEEERISGTLYTEDLW